MGVPYLSLVSYSNEKAESKTCVKVMKAYFIFMKSENWATLMKMSEPYAMKIKEEEIGQE